MVRKILHQYNLQDRSIQLNILTPEKYKLKPTEPHYLQPRGAAQRNLALSWLRDSLPLTNSDTQHKIIYFMDDDNTYSLKVFSEMTKIERGKVGIWPVGFVGGMYAAMPILTKKGTVKNIRVLNRSGRKFPLDMAAFAISWDLMVQHPEAVFSYEQKNQESDFLKNLTVFEEMQPLGNKCTEVLVWHTRTAKPFLRSFEIKRMWEMQNREDLVSQS